MYKIGTVVYLKKNLVYREKVNEYCTVNAVASFFSGYPVKIIKHYTEHKSIGYGVRYKDSREFFISEEMIHSIVDKS